MSKTSKCHVTVSLYLWIINMSNQTFFYSLKIYHQFSAIQVHQNKLLTNSHEYIISIVIYKFLNTSEKVCFFLFFCKTSFSTEYLDNSRHSTWTAKCTCLVLETMSSTKRIQIAIIQMFKTQSPMWCLWGNVWARMCTRFMQKLFSIIPTRNWTRVSKESLIKEVLGDKQNPEIVKALSILGTTSASQDDSNRVTCLIDCAGVFKVAYYVL